LDDFVVLVGTLLLSMQDYLLVSPEVVFLFLREKEVVAANLLSTSTTVAQAAAFTVHFSLTSQVPHEDTAEEC
jgi:hypothetical protein